jgi:hypothetical protein
MFYRVVMALPRTYTVSWCNLQFPNQINIQANSPLTVYGRLYIPGLTDNSPGADPAPAVRSQFGFGPAGTAPAGNSSWTWINAVPSASYFAANTDEYSATALFLAAGSYDCLFRFSGDSGTTWVYGGLSTMSAGTSPILDAAHATVSP